MPLFQEVQAHFLKKSQNIGLTFCGMRARADISRYKISTFRRRRMRTSKILKHGH